MDALIQISEILRNLTLPGIALFAALIATWQARMIQRRNGMEQIAKSVELLDRSSRAQRQAAIAMLLDATQNRTVSAVALEAISTYIDEVTDAEELKAIAAAAEGTPARPLIDIALDDVAGDDMTGDDLAGDEERRD